MFFGRKTIFDIIKEADEDASPTAQNDTDGGADAAPSPEESNADNGNDDYGSEDDLNIDTSLDDDNGGGDDLDMGDTDGGGDSGGSSSTSSGGGDTEEETDDEAVETNKDIFSSLSAQEQQIKIMELKRLYNEMYNAINDTLIKLNDSIFDDNNKEVINRVSESLFSLKTYIQDYIQNVFPLKSYIENDISFNRFLAILNSIKTVVLDLANKQDKK